MLQGSFSTQELNPRLLHCRQILYPLSHQGSLLVLLKRIQKDRSYWPSNIYGALAVYQATC